MKQYNRVVAAGTFDFFHLGHKEFLRFILSFGKNAVIGITSNKYIKEHKFEHDVEPFEKRKEAVENFLREETHNRVEIISIDNLYGPILDSEFDADAIAVSENTKKGAELINKKRKEKKLPTLPIVVLKLIKGEAGVISSSNIRNGIMDRVGKPYINSMWSSKELYLPEDVRNQLKKPLGNIVSESEIVHLNPLKIITVGDVVTKTFNALSIGQRISIIDFFVGRKRQFNTLEELGFSGSEIVLKAKNPPGSLTPSLFRTIQKAFVIKDKRIVIEVEGEEDLAVLPVLLSAPFGFTVFYGQPREGMVKVEVTEKNKEKIYGLVDRFVSKANAY